MPRQLRRPDRLLQRQGRCGGIQPLDLEIAQLDQSLGQQRAIARLSHLCFERTVQRQPFGETTDVAEHAELGQSRPQAIDGGPGRRIVRWLHHGAQQLHVGTPLQVAERTRRADGIFHHLGVGLAEGPGQRPQAVEALVEAGHAQVENLCRLLAAHVGRLAGIDVHRGPARGVLVEDHAHLLEGGLGVLLSGREKGLADGALGRGLDRSSP